MPTQLFKRIISAGLLALALASSTTPHASASTSYTITITKLECIEKQDSWANGSDEPTVTVNAMPVYYGSGYNDGTLKDFSDRQTTVYDEFAISIWEEDVWPDADDYVGYITLTSADLVGEGEKHRIIGSTNGKYRVFFKIDY